MLLVVFIAGGLLGATFAAKSIHSRMQQFRRNPEVLRGKITARLQRNLKLTREQKEQVREIFERRHSNMVALHRQAGAEARIEFNTMEREIGAILNEDQAHEWRKLAERVRGRYLLPQTSASDKGADL